MLNLCENFIPMLGFWEICFFGRFFSCYTEILVSLIALPSFVDMMEILICGNRFVWLLDLNLNLETLWSDARSIFLILLVGKSNLFHLIVIMILVLFWCKNVWISPRRKTFEDAWILPNRIGFFALSVLLKLLVIIWGSICSM